MDDDELYLLLLGARENLCRAQVLLADDRTMMWMRFRLDGALEAIDFVGSRRLTQWSKMDRSDLAAAQERKRIRDEYRLVTVNEEDSL